MIDFEWDPAKEKINRAKHHVGFDEAASVFKDSLGITVFDPDHSMDEDRYITVGVSIYGRLMMVAHTERGHKIRIISARKLTKTERKVYESEIEQRRK